MQEIGLSLDVADNMAEMMKRIIEEDGVEGIDAHFKPLHHELVVEIEDIPDVPE